MLNDKFLNGFTILSGLIDFKQMIFWKVFSFVAHSIKIGMC